jgi:hypothetical protein
MTLHFTPQTLLVLTMLFLFTFTRSAMGFGDASVEMPLLTLVIGMRQARPQVALGASTIAITILLGAWRQVDVQAAWRLILSTLLGIPVGLILLKAAPEQYISGYVVRSGVVRAGLKEKAGETVAQAKATFEEGLETIRHNAKVFIKKVRDMPDPPDEVEVAFGLKATGEMGNFAVAKAGAEANYTVKLTWKREQPEDEKTK